MRRRFISCLMIILPFLVSATGLQINNSTTTCWTEPFQPNCSTSDSPVGNLAFLSFDNLLLDRIAATITNIFENFNSAGWQETISKIDYHISINYLPCTDPNYTIPIHNALSSFNWQSFTVYTSRLCCEPGYLEVCLDDNSQKLVTNFSLAIRDHLISYDIPILEMPDYQLLQPPYHITIGIYKDDLYNISDAFSNFFGSSSILNQDLDIVNQDLDIVNQDLDIDGLGIHLDVFYFGDQPYFASDFSQEAEIDLIYLLLLLLLLPLICFFVCCFYGCICCGKRIVCCACCAAKSVNKIICCCC